MTADSEVKIQKLFRFQDMDIWKKAMEIGDQLLDVADNLEHRKLFRFSEQLRAAALSISNNIAEGSGSDSPKDFAHFLNMAKRSAFENANMVMAFSRRGLLDEAWCQQTLQALAEECRMISGFIKALK